MRCRWLVYQHNGNETQHPSFEKRQYGYIDRGVHTKNFLSNSANTTHRPDDEIDSDVSFSSSFLSIFGLCVLEDPS